MELLFSLILPMVISDFAYLIISAQELLLRHCGLFFAPLALVVVNDDSARCKKMAAMAIKALLAQLDINHQNTMYSFVNTWLHAEKVQIHKCLQYLCSAFHY